MHIKDLPFSGHYEQVGDISETLQVAVPDTDNETATLEKSIVDGVENITDDSARRGYSFRYEVSDYLGDGLFALRVDAQDASGVGHAAEIAAAVTLSTDPAASAAEPVRLPMWFISKKHHYKRVEGDGPGYSGPAFGRLHFPDTDRLPHRRLFQGMG